MDTISSSIGDSAASQLSLSSSSSSADGEAAASDHSLADEMTSQPTDTAQDSYYRDAMRGEYEDDYVNEDGDDGMDDEEHGRAEDDQMSDAAAPPLESASGSSGTAVTAATDSDESLLRDVLPTLLPGVDPERTNVVAYAATGAIGKLIDNALISKARQLSGELDSRDKQAQSQQ